MELKDIKGLGEKRLLALQEKGITTPLDLLKIEPTKYLDYTDICGVDKKSDCTQTAKVEIISPAKCAYFKGRSSVSVKVMDLVSGATFTAVWFNQPFMKSNLHEEDVYFLTGKFNKAHQFTVQTAKLAEKVNDAILPVYGASAGITTQIIISTIKQILDSGENFSVLSEDEEYSANLTSLMSAFKELHFPTSIEALEEAKQRINFEDMLLLASLEHKLKQSSKTKSRQYNTNSLNDFISACPYTLTVDQKKVLDEIMDDLNRKEVMNRLVLGDVGSGKTLVALGAGFVAIKSGYQAVLLCPTEILAEQHYKSAVGLLSSLGVNIKLLHAKMSMGEKRGVIEGLKSGEVQFLITTHSGLSDGVQFKNLGLVITDEQHRFGVGQRATIEGKGNNPDVIVMSATPIPRSLSLVLFGGLDVSEINSRPNGDSKIKTNIVPSFKEQKMWGYILNEIENNNGKCFVIAPRIEEGQESNLFSVEELEKRLTDFGVPKEMIVTVHGRTDKKEANQIIDAFKNGNKKVLISTTVVEVGIDVPTANLMVIYNADRFGLATLHQLRGRVGRDGREGYCFAFTENDSDKAMNRLEIFKKYNSGVRLAEEDLKIRGGGTIYGTKQHGASEIFLNLDFSVEEYKKAQNIINKLEYSSVERISANAEKSFGKIYKNIALN